ncbi:MAG: beta strand repeat-containing protein, partial [Chthoniobacterales bacterium]
ILLLSGSGGGAFTNTNHLIQALADSEVQLTEGVSITGGTLSTTGSGLIRVNGSQNVYLTSLTNAGNIVVDNNSLLHTNGTITNNGTITLNSAGNNTDLHLDSNTTLTGGGTVTLALNGASRIAADGLYLLTNMNNLIQGRGQVGVNSIIIDNQGTIAANVTGQTLTIDPANLAEGFGLTNTGVLQASNGGILLLTGNGGGIFGNDSGTIQALDGSQVQLTADAYITGGVLSAGGSGSFQVNGSQNVYLGDVTLSAPLSVQNNSFLHALGTITNTGTITLLSSGNNTDFRLADDVTLNGGGTVTLANNAASRISGDGVFRLTNVNNMIQGQGQIGVNGIAITNQSLINANVSGQNLTIDPASKANVVDGGSSFLNQGTLQASNGGILVLSGNGGGAFTNSGTIQALEGSQVQLTAGASIIGGTISTTGGGFVQVNGSQQATITNVTNTGVLNVLNNAFLNTAGTITNTGTITLNSAGNNTDLHLVANTTLHGSGTLTLAGNTASRIAADSLFNLTNTNNLIQGRGQIGVNSITITNQGTIDANVSGQTLTLDPANSGNGFTNDAGVMRATNGGILVLSGNGGGAFLNTGGSIAALAGSTVQLVNGVSVTGGTLNGGGTGVVRVPGSNNAYITNLTTLGTIVVDNNSALHTSGAISDTGTITLNSAGNNTDFSLAADTTLSGNGSLILASNNAARITGDSLFRLTNAEATIQGRGQIGVNTITITNQAAINANVSGQTLTIDPANSTSAFVNESSGTVQASNGGILVLSGNGGGDFANAGTISAVSGGSIQVTGAVNSTGTVDVGSDSMSITGSGSYTQTAGTFRVAGGTVTSSTELNFTNGLVDARGTINAAVTSGANIQPALGSTTGLVVNGSHLNLLSSSRLTFQLGGLTQGSQYGYLNVNGTVALNGNLVVSFANSFQPANSNQFTILTGAPSTALSGSFTNVNSGGRLTVSDGSGSFVVSYDDSDHVTLSDYQPNGSGGSPQPAEAAATPQPSPSAKAKNPTRVAHISEAAVDQDTATASHTTLTHTRGARPVAIRVENSDQLLGLMEGAKTTNSKGRITVKAPPLKKDGAQGALPNNPANLPASGDMTPRKVTPKSNPAVTINRPDIDRVRH